MWNQVSFWEIWCPIEHLKMWLLTRDLAVKRAVKLSGNKWVVGLNDSDAHQLYRIKRIRSCHTSTLSRTQDIVTKINILLQEIRDIKKQNKRNNIFNVHMIHPKDTGEGNALDDTHSIYNSASIHLPPDIQNTPEHHVLNPNHTPSIDDSAFTQQKPTPYELWSASPPESLSSSSSNEDSTDDIVGRT